MSCIWQIHNPKEGLESSAHSPTTTLFSAYEKMYHGSKKALIDLLQARTTKMPAENSVVKSSQKTQITTSQLLTAQEAFKQSFFIDLEIKIII